MKLSISRDELNLLAEKYSEVQVTGISQEKGVTIKVKVWKLELELSLKPLAGIKDIIPVELITPLGTKVLNKLGKIANKDAASILEQMAPDFIKRESDHLVIIDIAAFCQKNNIPFTADITSIDFANESLTVELNMK